jgi:DNA-binding response OmpR family regulator
MSAAASDRASDGASVRVLVVEDAPEFLAVVVSLLRQEGFGVEQATDGEAAVEIARTVSPEVVVLDLNLPKLDGIEVCRRIRTFSDAYVIMLTAKTDEVDKLIGLSVGADDYMTKPFSPRELVARLRAVLRRAGPEPTRPGTRTLRAGTVELDLDRRLVAAGGAPVALTATEFDLLAALVARPGLVFTRERLLSQVWGYQAAAGTRTVDVHVAQVRAKLGDASPIRTVRGVGYTADA